MDVLDYIREEVNRQGHNTSRLDGIERVGWMIEGWCFALSDFVLSLDNIEHLGRLVERRKNAVGFRRVGVRVGYKICPPPDSVIPQLSRLLTLHDSMTPIEFYKEFELIHPFVDGNGRTGKILLNWKNGTLLDPIFPPNDLWGRPILNP